MKKPVHEIQSAGQETCGIGRASKLSGSTRTPIMQLRRQHDEYISGDNYLDTYRGCRVTTKSPIPIERIQSSIYLIRGEKVMLDFDLAKLYSVETWNLTRTVSRNLDRFPNDFMFQLSKQEFTDLKRQIGGSSWGGRRRSSPRAFTQEGVAMLSSILRSKRAAHVNIQIMRTFLFNFDKWRLHTQSSLLALMNLRQLTVTTSDSSGRPLRSWSPQILRRKRES